VNQQRSHHHVARDVAVEKITANEVKQNERLSYWPAQEASVVLRASRRGNAEIDPRIHRNAHYSFITPFLPE